jgi:hypothetical protein
VGRGDLGRIGDVAQVLGGEIFRNGSALAPAMTAGCVAFGVARFADPL